MTKATVGDLEEIDVLAVDTQDAQNIIESAIKVYEESDKSYGYYFKMDKSPDFYQGMMTGFVTSAIIACGGGRKPLNNAIMKTIGALATHCKDKGIIVVKEVKKVTSEEILELFNTGMCKELKLPDGANNNDMVEACVEFLKRGGDLNKLYQDRLKEIEATLTASRQLGEEEKRELQRLSTQIELLTSVIKLLQTLS
jgi:hypothetical protein